MGLLGTIGGGILKGVGSLTGWSWATNLGDALMGTSQAVQQQKAQQASLAGAERQAQLEQSIFDYQKSLQQTLFQREDNAVQRRVADLEASGLSKTLAAGSAANAGQPVSVSTPHDAELLKGQALTQGLQNMLAIAQSQAIIKKVNAEANLISEQAQTEAYNRDWFEDANLPTGVKSGVFFMANALAKQFGTSSKEIATGLINGIKSILSKFGIDENTLSSVFDSVFNSSPTPTGINFESFEGKSVSELIKDTKNALIKEGKSSSEADSIIDELFSHIPAMKTDPSHYGWDYLKNNTSLYK